MTSYYVGEEEKDDCYYLKFMASNARDSLSYLTIDIEVDKSIMKECGIHVYRGMINDIIQDDIRRERNRDREY